MDDFLNKKSARHHLKQRIANLTSEDKFHRSFNCGNNLLQFLASRPHPVRVLGLYAPIDGEVHWNESPEFVAWIEEGLKKGMKVSFPKFTTNEKEGMKFYVSASCRLEELNVIEVFGKKMLVPDPVEEVIPDCQLIPGLGFTDSGFRLGRGKGYYDRYLEGKTNLKIGLTFETQLVSNLPIDLHDVKMDMVITDQRIMKVV